MNDDKQILSTKLSIGDYNTFLILTKLEYQAGLIKEESTSELLRFTILHILNQLCNDQIYPYLEQEQQQEQKKAQNNQHQQQQRWRAWLQKEVHIMTLIRLYHTPIIKPCHTTTPPTLLDMIATRLHE